MEIFRIDEPGLPTLLRFSGSDALRYLNGQVTQDVRLVRDGLSLPACVTDAKGRLQFRVWLLATDDGAYWLSGPPGCAEELEQRMTRYLIADDVEVEDITGTFRLVHFTGQLNAAPPEVLVRRANRYGSNGTDWWIPTAKSLQMPHDVPALSRDQAEDLRIRMGIPAWGKELLPGMLPPEAGLDATDISYHKGCYIGQEVISRIKFAGKLNRRLATACRPADELAESAGWFDSQGRPLREVTSLSPILVDGCRHALGYRDGKSA